MKLQPNETTALRLSDGTHAVEAQLLHIKEHTLVINCCRWEVSDNPVQFKSAYFYGEGMVTSIEARGESLQLALQIDTIHFRRGILINEVL